MERQLACSTLACVVDKLRDLKACGDPKGNPR